jgi:hypothetical protein
MSDPVGPAVPPKSWEPGDSPKLNPYFLYVNNPNVTNNQKKSILS